MNIFQPFKLHLYTYRKVYFLFWIFNILSSSLILFLFKSIDKIYYYLTIGILFLTLIYTILIAVYEYHRLCFHYLNLKTFRLGFFISSIIHAILNGISQTLLTFLLFFGIHQFYMKTNIIDIALIDQTFPYMMIPTYILIFLSHITLTFFINVLVLLLRNINRIKAYLYAIILIIMSFFFDEILNFIITNTNVIFFNSSLIYSLIPISVVLCILLLSITYFKFKRIDMKK